ncbi:hypothetical protein J8L84_18930 [Alteromonas sp. MMG017]|uniref:hypothetical protein n=1 Tax=Alteromonas sp. MMG017 TaxID=2822692 RepID=UPI001B3A590E|nr:hypothetical protein [Alteromonas sp. MMG017]MBQ4831358.1 hypothetical protein [Alteromonas sp. MMG017]
MFRCITRLQSIILPMFQRSAVAVFSTVLCVNSAWVLADTLDNEVSLYGFESTSSLSSVFTHDGSVKVVSAFITEGFQYNGERIAISADGNNQADHHTEARWPRADEDDWAGTAATLAMLAKEELQDKLVHYSFNNFIEAPPHTNETNYMADSVTGAIEWWNFPKSKFFDVSKNTDRAIEHLAREIAKSSEHDPLYFINMGPSEFLYQAVARVIDIEKIASLSYVYVISHSGYNDNHLRRKAHHTMSDVLLLSGNRIHYKRIIDQNGCDKPTTLWCSKSFEPFEWLRTHDDPSLRWLWERMQHNPKNKADLSDAGMVFFLLKGDEHGNPQKFRRFLGDSVMPR